MKKGIVSVCLVIFFNGCIFTPSANTLNVRDNNYYQGDIDLIRIAKDQLGIRYRYGGISPSVGFDCSGFVYYVYGKAGIKLPRTSLDQSRYGRLVSKDELESGDLLFFDTSNRGHINHSGIYIGNGKFIHASSGRAHCVTISKLNSEFYKRSYRWARRVN